MALETRLQMKLVQKLTLTQNLQLAIKMLQMNKLELEAAVNQALLENPVLEILEPDETPEPELPLNPDYPTVSQFREEHGAAEFQEIIKTKTEDQKLSDVEWDMILDETPDAIGMNLKEDREFVSSENYVANKGPTLYEHLLWQLSLSRISGAQKTAALEIIGAINDDGYLPIALSELAEKAGVDLATVEAALAFVQDLDPVGVGARNPRECLLLQLEETSYKGTIIEKIIADHLPELGRNAYPEIAKALNITITEVKDAVEIIQRLEPKPGRAFLPRDTQYITPDVYVVKVDDDYEILLNDEGIPRLRVSQLYKRILSSRTGVAQSTRDYVQKKVRNALWLINSIDQRQRTIYKVSECIVRIQREFLDRGIGYLKPLILKDVSEEIGVSESTVSRVSTNKFIHTPQGLFEIKFFFHSGLGKTNGDSVSSLTVKEQLKTLIAVENQRKPLSDGDITKELNKRGIMIKRRTVAKYREELNIPTANRRKVY